jgi:nucleotide-binding universal stress UspA family protein
MDVALPRRIVVGVNGSTASLAALRWAAGEAALRRASLLVVYVWDRTRRVAPYATLGGRPTPGEERSTARARLASALRTAFGPTPPACLSSEVAEGLVARVLLDRAADADLLVLGATAPAITSPPAGRGGGPTAGPVARACLSRAVCPVVIVSTAVTGGGGEAPPPAGSEGHGAAAPASTSPFGYRGGR